MKMAAWIGLCIHANSQTSCLNTGHINYEAKDAKQRNNPATPLLPDTKDDLQKCAQARDEENVVNEPTLGQAVVLQTQALGEN